MRGLVILRISLVLVSVVGVIRSSTSTSTTDTLDDDEGPSVRRVEGSSKVTVMTHSREGRGGDVAWGTFVDSSEKKSNFGVLEVHTSGEYGDEEQMFAAGFLEGYVTAKRISENFRNLHAYFTGTMNASLDAPMDWIHTQDDWMRTMCNEHTGMGMTPGRWKGHVSAGRNKRRKRRERFWMAVCLSVRQFDGLISGYQHAAKENQELPPMGYSDFLFLESNGDLYDVIDSMDPSQRPHWNISNKALFLKDIALSGKCSALVKLAPDLSDIYMGHSTWDSYTAMLRIYKHYTFNLTELQPAAQHMSFSSYPGEVFSDDDFFILGSRLVLLQTTNKMFNGDVLQRLDPHSILSWQRVRAANFLASAGDEWARIFKRENSGTYNNQYMVVDLNKFDPSHQLVMPGLLTVIEQIPGLVVFEDLTQTLLEGYWPSMNIPYFPEIYKQSGYPDFDDPELREDEEYYDMLLWLSYTSSPRSNIFRRDQSKVDSLDAMKSIMRYNGFQSDPYSKGNPVFSICGRGDLSDPASREARGCYDSKVTSYSLALNYRAEVINGPTRGSDHSLPPFSWHEIENPPLHSGQPDGFEFEFEMMEPTAALQPIVATV